MTNPSRDPLSAALRRDAADALPEPSAQLDGDIRRALDAAYARTRPEGTDPQAFVEVSRRRTGPLLLLLSSAAAVLLAALSLHSLSNDPVLQPAPVPAAERLLSLSLQHPSAKLFRPLASFVAAVNQPLLAEWEHLTQDATGTADYLLAQVQGPLRGLRSLAKVSSLSPGHSAVKADG